MHFYNREKGITLIALVITIIILIILAGISISELTGNKLFDKAKLSKNKSENAQELENEILLNYEREIDGLGENSGEEIKFTNIDISKTNPAGAMPNGSKIIENNAEKGIVIEDSRGNQWTWVEVPKIEVFKTAKEANSYEAINYDLIQYVTNPTNYRQTEFEDKYYDGCGILSDNDKTAEQVYEGMYQKMLSSIYTNGGFWISKYELGIEGSNNDISKARIEYSDITETSPKPVSKADHIPYNWLYCREAQFLASQMSADITKTSSLLFGIQWDLVCKYLEVKADWDITTYSASYYLKENSTSWGNYYNKKLEITSRNAKYCKDLAEEWEEITEDEVQSLLFLTTGASDETNKLNICDFAGNLFEYTLERCNNGFYTTFRAGKQGYGINSNFSAYRRLNDKPSHCTYYVGARATLY